MRLKLDHFNQQAEFFAKIFLTLESRDEDLKEFLGMRHQTSHIIRRIAPYLCQVSSLKISVESHEIKLWWWTGVANSVWLHCIRWRLSYSYSDSESNKEETFSTYFEKVFFFQRIVHEIGLARRLYIVWGRYNPISVKENTRDNRDTAVGNERVTGSAKVPRDWQTFLKNANNKKRAFFYISVQYAIDRTIAGPKRAVLHRRIVWSMWLKELQWGNATMKRQIPAY